MREGFKGPEYYKNWDSQKNRPPVSSSSSARTEHVPQPYLNIETKRAQMKEQMRSVQSRIDAEKMAIERLKRDGLGWQAQSKEATIKALEYQVKQLQSDMEKLAA